MLQEKVKKYQSHNHTFTCAKKRKMLTIKANEGFGRLDGYAKGIQLLNIPVCRFYFPKFPLDETKLIPGMSKDIDEDVMKMYKTDLIKIIKYLVRQTHTENRQIENEAWVKMKSYLFLAREAGTGKSHLVQVLIEVVKINKLKAGAELKKPPVIVMAPTANAAFIIGGKTIDSALGFSPMDVNRYTQANPGKMAMMKFQYEDVEVLFCDEISMVGSMKLAKINYRLQDLVEGSKKQDFMGGISFVASGKTNILIYKAI